MESGVGHPQKTPLKGQRFENLAETQAYGSNSRTRARLKLNYEHSQRLRFASSEPILEIRDFGFASDL